MNRKILAGLALLVAVAAAPGTAIAQTTTAPPPMTSAPAAVPMAISLTPFQLANLAYEGGLQAQGIPSYVQLENALAQSEINAQKVVAAAVEAGYVSANTIDDGSYINALRMQLRYISPGDGDYWR